jgi:hypothetical protein
MRNEELVAAVGWMNVLRHAMFALFLLLCPSFFISCSSPTPEERASLAAKGYYDHLIAGEYDAYLEGVDGMTEAPADYRQQQRVSAEQFMQQLRQQHKGISSVEVSSAKTDSSLHCTNVFLLICFGDSTREEICVPMVERNGSFRMR